MRIQSEELGAGTALIFRSIAAHRGGADASSARGVQRPHVWRRPARASSAAPHVAVKCNPPMHDQPTDTPPDSSMTDWLLACPERGFFVPIDSESTDDLQPIYSADE